MALCSDEDSLKGVKSFKKWISDNGGFIHESLVFKNDPNYGLCLYSTVPLDSNTKLLACPFELAITPAFATSSILAFASSFPSIVPATGQKRKVSDPDAVLNEFKDKVEQWNHNQRTATYLMLSLLSSVAASNPVLFAHAPYIELLPKKEDILSPLFFNEQEMGLIRGTNLYGGTIELRQKLRSEGLEVIDVLKNLGMEIDEDEFSDLYLLSSYYLLSRAFPSRVLSLQPATTSPCTTIDSHPVLLPGVDLLNHRHAERVAWISTPSSSSSTGEVTLVLEAPIEAGTQVFNNYGAKASQSFFLAYGFVPLPNPSDVLNLQLGILPPEVHEAVVRELSGEIDPRANWDVKRDGVVPQGLRRLFGAVLKITEGIEKEDEEGFVLDGLEELVEVKMGKIVGFEREAGRVKGCRNGVEEICDAFINGQKEIYEAILEWIDLERERLEDEK